MNGTVGNFTKHVLGWMWTIIVCLWYWPVIIGYFIALIIEPQPAQWEDEDDGFFKN
ncbi:hypothetical protein LCGC14_1720610 [marine sediment metagenome]|uniref:Uncharacterized protein n=1 Tax=marine sediment metagenome TaxID=412755 RepID=A0A0F9HCD3_9ZZZZ